MTRKIQPMINLPKYNPSTGVSGPALSHAAVKTATPAQEKITLQKEQDEREDGQASPGKQATHEDSKDRSYLPLSKDEVSLGTDDFIVPKEPLEQERFKRQLIATARSLKKK